MNVKGVNEMNGFNIMVERKKRKWTQDQLCEKVGIGRKTLSDIENGKVDNVTRKLMVKFAEVLETDVQTLFFSED